VVGKFRSSSVDCNSNEGIRIRKAGC